MTDETKKLFDAPWTVVSPDDPEEDRLIIIAAGGLVKIANDVETLVYANRLARLPELYDALMVAAYEHCRVCLYGHVKDARHMPKPDDMARNGCTLSDFPHCPNRNWWNLLKKVRDGE